MRRVRGVVHGTTAGLTVPQKGGRLAREATLDRTSTPQLFLASIHLSAWERNSPKYVAQTRGPLPPLEAQSTPSAS
jgi:hypothetical protein